MTGSHAVHISGLSHVYPGEQRKSLDNISLNIFTGSRFGIFGPNGAGKTTLLSCITGLLQYREGKIEVMGENIASQRKHVIQKIGLVPQDFAFYSELSTVENLGFFGALYGLSRSEIKERVGDLTEKLDLGGFRNKALHQLSGGMKRRVNLAIGVMHMPSLLILDEPTVGVDIHSRTEIMGFLKEMNEKGTTIIYTSHQLAEAEELCNDVAFISDGQLLIRDSLAHLRSEYNGKSLEELFVQLTARKEKT